MNSLIGPLPADGIPSGLPGIVISGGTEVSLSAACAGAAEMVAKAVATMVVSEVRAAAILFDLFMFSPYLASMQGAGLTL